MTETGILVQNRGYLKGNVLWSSALCHTHTEIYNVMSLRHNFTEDEINRATLPQTKKSGNSTVGCSRVGRIFSSAVELADFKIRW